MDSTDNRGYPFPECDAPLTKDASDIANLRDLAMAVDEDVQNAFFLASDTVVRPDAARMSMAATVVSTENATFPFYNVMTFDTTGTSMTPTAEGFIRLVEPGWYQVGMWANLDQGATFLGARARFLQNGVPATSFSTQAELASANLQLVSHTATIYVPVGGDSLGVEIRVGVLLPNFTYASRIWAVQVARG